MSEIKTSETITIIIPLEKDGVTNKRSITLDNPKTGTLQMSDLAVLNDSVHAGGYSTLFQPTGWDSASELWTVPAGQNLEFQITEKTVTTFNGSDYIQP